MSKRRNGEGTRRKKQGRDLIEARIPYTDEFGAKKYQTIYAKTDRELDEKIFDFKTKLNSGLPPKQSNLTLKQWSEMWVTDYLPAISTLRETTQELYASLAKTHIQLGPLGNTKICEIDGTHIDNFLAERSSKAGISNSTRRTLHTVLNHHFKTAVTKKLIPTNPVRDSHRPPKIRKEAVWLTQAELDAVLDELELTRSRHLPIVEFIVLTGVRRGEALALKWSDVDFEKNTLQIRATMTRTKGRYGPTPPKTSNGVRPFQFNVGIAELLKEVRQQQRLARLAAGARWTNTNYVFTSAFGTPVDGRSVYRSVKKATDAVLTKHAGVHTLRHSAATLLLEGNFKNAHIVSRTLGHASISITMDLYGHLNTDGQQEVFKQLEDVVRIRSGNNKSLRNRKFG